MKRRSLFAAAAALIASPIVAVLPKAEPDLLPIANGGTGATLIDDALLVRGRTFVDIVVANNALLNHLQAKGAASYGGIDPTSNPHWRTRV